MVGRAKHKHQPHAPASDKTEITPLPPAGKYSGRISRERAIEMLEHAKKYIGTLAPDSWLTGDNWGDIRWLTERTLSRAVDSLRPIIREVWLPRPYPEEPGSNWRKYEYRESLREAAEVTYEILKSAGAECGQEFQEILKGWLVKQFRRKDATRLAKPDKKVNLEMIRILRGTSARCTPHPMQLKALAPGGKYPDRWAHDARIQLARFCERVYRVWQQSDSPPLEKIHFISTIRSVFLAECSLEFPRDICVAQEAIERGQELSRNRKLRELLKTHSAKLPRRR